MEDGDSDSRSSNDIPAVKDSQNFQSKTQKRAKKRITSIVNEAEILSERDIRSENFSLKELIQTDWKDMLSCLKWMAKRRLIWNTLSCQKCGQLCSFQLRSDRTDKYNWLCNSCNFKKSVREGSFFAESHLSLPTILQLIYHWTLKERREDVQRSLCIKQRHTIVDWYAFIREICARKVIDTPQHIGGLREDTLESKVVAFGVFDFMHSKEQREEVYWVALGVESETDRCFMIPMESRDTSTIVNVLCKYVEPGTILLLLDNSFQTVTEETSMQSLPDDVLSFAYNYAVTIFSDFSSVALYLREKPTNLWKLLRKQCSKAASKPKGNLFGEDPTTVSLFQSYIQETIWRQLYSADHFTNLLADIASYYPFDS